MTDSQRKDIPEGELFRRLRARREVAARLEVGESIGQGAMSVVYRAHEDELHRDVAMKVMRDVRGAASSGAASSSRMVTRFIDETQVTAQLDHPGIVPVYQLGLDANDQLFFTMKLVRGQTLKEVFELVKQRDEGWTVTRAAGLLLRVCEAMAYAHSKKVIHRDLKPGNVMVGRFGEVYVMDWGLARVLDQPDLKDVRIREPEATSQVDTDKHDLLEFDADSPLHTMDGDVVGTPAYMSPEQAHGLRERIGPQTDVYAIGAILYHLLSGQMPYVTRATHVGNYAIWRWVREGPPTPLELLAPKAPDDLVAICNKAMQRELEARYASAQELADDLRRYLEGRPVSPRSGLLIALAKLIARNKAVSALAAGLLLAVVIGGYVIAAKEREAADEAGRSRDAYLAKDLLARADKLGPINAASLPSLERWIAEASELLERRAAYVEMAQRLELDALAAGVARRVQREPDADLVSRWEVARELVERNERTLRARRARAEAPGATPAMLEDLRQSESVLPRETVYWKLRVDELAPLVAPQEALQFEDGNEQRRYDSLAELASSLSRLHGTTLPRVRERAALARTFHERTVSAAAAALAWQEAARSIADRSLCPRYEGRTLALQEGLLPLRRDARSGLWEFWHLPSGERPEPDGDAGWFIGPDTGVVLVLIPGGRVQVGAQSAAPDEPRYDPQATATEKPWSIELPRYFISKYELTQGQWWRLTGEMVSEHFAGQDTKNDPCVTRSNPVENISQFEATAVLRSVGLALPTEAQWERAARGDSELRYVVGDQAQALQGFENIFGIEDGYEAHAPVGRYPGNGYGLHDMLGNVSEWCRDWYCDTETLEGAQVVDSERVPSIRQLKVFRGGNFKRASSSPYLRVSSRLPRHPEAIDDFLGVRPARAVDP